MIQAKPNILKELSRLNILTAKDLLTYYPKRYIDFSKIIPISKMEKGVSCTVKVKITQINSRFSFKTRKNIVTAIGKDASGQIAITWFNMPYIAKTLQIGKQYAFAGKPNYYKGLQFINPIFETESEDNLHTGRLVPVYKLPPAITSKIFRKLVYEHLKEAVNIEQITPSAITKKFNLLETQKVINTLHFPNTEQDINKAHHTLAFEELFIKKLAVLQIKKANETSKASPIKANIDLVKDFFSTLPFTPTDDQKKVLWQIMQDMKGKTPMSRMILGDVGSGKTLVACASALLAQNVNQQTALLAPTEILARQHYESIKKLIIQSNQKDTLALLTSGYAISSQTTEKKEILANIKNGKSQIIIGTHALLSGKVKFKKLNLIIIDEQHRFGVKQRKTLTTQKKHTPHLLSMSATPIPRSLALSLFGELKISRINQMPSGRIPVETQFVIEEERQRIYTFSKNLLKQGQQMFVVVSRIEDDEEETKNNIKEKTEEIKREFKALKVESIHGKMKSKEREKIMQDFADKKFDILVATTVIEIGIDIKNATIIIIEDADTFGLAQLHQLRGRVGRSNLSSYCFLFSKTENEDSINRLTTLTKTHSGLKLAESDLATRGFGSLYGIEQSGFVFMYPQHITLQALERAKIASEIFEKDYSLDDYPLLKQKVEESLPEIHME